MTTRDSAGFAVAGGEAPQVVFAGQIEGALPFDSALLEARINKNRLHEMRGQLDVLFADDEYTAVVTDVNGQSTQEWKVLPMITVPVDGEEHAFQLARKCDRKSRRDPDIREDTYLVYRGGLNSPLLEFDVETQFQPHEKLIDLLTIDFDANSVDNPEQITLFERIVDSYSISYKLAATQAEDAARTERERVERERQEHDRFIRKMLTRGGSALVGASMLGGAIFGLIKLTDESPEDVARQKAEAAALAQNVKKALPNSSYVKAGSSKVRMVELKDGKALVTLADHAPDSGGQSDTDAKAKFPKEDVSASNAKDLGKTVAFDLPTEVGSCTLVATPSPSDAASRIEGAFVATGKGAPGDYSVQVIRKTAELSNDDGAENQELTAVAGMAKVCMTAEMQNDPSANAITTGFIRMVDASEAPAR